MQTVYSQESRLVLYDLYVNTHVCAGTAMSAQVRCNRTDRQTGSRPAGVSSHTPVTTHRTARSHIPQRPHCVHTMSAQSPASRTSGSSNVKYSHGDKRWRDGWARGEDLRGEDGENSLRRSSSEWKEVTRSNNVTNSGDFREMPCCVTEAGILACSWFVYNEEERFMRER